MKEKFLKQAKHEYSPGKRIIALMIEGIFFLGILPGTLIYFSPLLDHQFELPPLAFGVINIILGCGFVVAGILFGWWAIYVQFTIGRGTPVPVMATQQLIIQKPYNYCRNPMALGAIAVYLGVAILTRTSRNQKGKAKRESCAKGRDQRHPTQVKDLINEVST
jgi:protein-S-isoprenylcysteine O-methyltransferase Ste14